ncbi:MAG: magnesium transporter [Gammaproteobacteria bacterium]|nr:MAG: magnesium transporter [Gammaproteobacteria bacterium]
MAGEKQEFKEQLERFMAHLRNDAHDDARALLAELHPAEIAHIIESLPSADREMVWQWLAADIRGAVLSHLHDDVRVSFIHNMGLPQLIAATEGLDTDDIADILQSLSDEDSREILETMDRQDRERVEQVLSYPEDTAGGLMNTDAITVRPNVSLDVVLRYLRLRGELPESTDKLFVVDRDDSYLGVLRIAQIVTLNATTTVAEAMISDFDAINVAMREADIANHFARHDILSAPVVDDHNRLLGRITIDDIVDVIREQGAQSLTSMAGLREEEGLFSPIWISTGRRAVWLGANLLTAFAASAVIAQFDATIEKIVVLAVLMPIVASMGGIAGSQTLTLVIRGLALGQVSSSNSVRLLRKEMAVGVLNGLLWAVVVTIVVVFWFDDYQIGAIIAVALVVNLIVAAFAGVAIPLLLRRMGSDPALGGSVLLTTVTDVIGFLVFLGLATVFLL